MQREYAHNERFRYFFTSVQYCYDKVTQILSSHIDVRKILIVWDVPMCRGVRGSRQFEDSYKLQARGQFCTADEGRATVRYIFNYSSKYTTSHRRRSESSQWNLFDVIMEVPRRGHVLLQYNIKIIIQRPYYIKTNFKIFIEISLLFFLCNIL